MKNLSNLNLQELSFEEQVNIDGGNIGGVLRFVNRLMNAAAAWDAIDGFKKGWNSVDCGCQK